jgi:uncharacterized SAM-binding protein YcdF (DUF218 family)
MPPPPAVRAGGTLRRILGLAALVICGAAVYAFLHLGSFLAAEDPLEKADAIFVLAGTPMSRQLEGADLFLSGYGRYIVLSQELNDPAFDVLAQRGLRFPTRSDRAHDVYLKLGIPPASIIVPERIHRNTAAEAQTLRELSAQHGWRRVIVVSSKYHLRRAGFAFRRELDDAGVSVVMRASRYDPSDPQRWWRRRPDVREIAAEAPRLLAYMAGLGA